MPWYYHKDIEIPKTWNFKKLSDCIHPSPSGTWGIDDDEIIPDEYVRVKVIRNTEFKNWNSNSIKKISYRLIKKNDFEKKSLKEGDILLETSGGGPKQPLARTIIIDKKTLENCQNQASFSNFIRIIRTKSEIKNIFLYYYLNYLYNQGITKNFETQTTNLRNFDFKWFLRNIIILIPPMSEQQKIISILSNVDNLIQNTEKIIQQTKIYKKGLNQNLLTKGIGHTKFKKVIFGRSFIRYSIPDEWKIKQLDEIFKFKNGVNKEKSFFGKGTPIVNVLDVYENSGLTQNQIKGKVTLTEDEINSFKLKKGDLVFTRTSETLEEIGTASVILNDLENTTFSGFLLRAQQKSDEFDNNFKRHWFRSNIIRRQIISTATKTSRALTTKNYLSQIITAIPPRVEQQQIASILSNTDEKIQSYERYKEKLQRLKKSLMQKLLTGEVRVAV